MAFRCPEESRNEYDGLSFASHMIAGATAGMVEHTFMYPIDTLKTRMQAIAQPGQQLTRRSVRLAMRAILKREGVKGFYNGVGAVALGSGPSHAVYFAVYELWKETLGGNRSGHRPMETALAGAMATAVSDMCMTPWDVIKQRLQVEGSPYKGITDCALRTWQSHGIGAFFKSYRTTLVMNVPFVAVHFPVYESAKKLMRASEEDEGLVVQMLAGGLAGGVSAFLTNPLDVVKTRIQTEGVNSSTVYSMSEVQTMRMILRQEGLAALLSGAKARVMFHMPAAAVSWCTYESMKTLLRG